jgi:hypothetical protein
MGVVASAVKWVAKRAVEGIGAAIPVVGGPLASYINSKYSTGSFDIGAMGIKKEDIPDGVKIKPINTPTALKAFIKANPEASTKYGLTVEMVDKEVEKAKEESRAIGGQVGMGKKMSKPVGEDFVKHELPIVPVKGKEAKMATGGAVKVKKPRSEKQIAATKRMLEGLKAKKAVKK